jgi:uncharacterized DUF497 family protein/predicted DNA binding CopG/RHH family protein
MGFHRAVAPDKAVAAKGPLENCVGFDWNNHNANKNWEKHGVTPDEAEAVFFHEPLVVRSDLRHSRGEKRHFALGQTSTGRRLFVSFTVRGQLVRVISARDMNQKNPGCITGMKKKIPEFKTDDAERNFWANADSTEYIDWPAGKRVKFVNLKPSLKTISLRLPVSMIEDLKVLANSRDVPYQSLLKVFLAERLARERQPRSGQD